MEYSIRISCGNMPTVSITVEADNVLDALENKIQFNSAYQELDKTEISDIVADVDIDTFPLDSMSLRNLNNGEWQVSFDDCDKYVLFNEKKFLSSARVLSENAIAIGMNTEETKRLLRYAADWIYSCGFSNIASNCA